MAVGPNSGVPKIGFKDMETSAMLDDLKHLYCLSEDSRDGIVCLERGLGTAEHSFLVDDRERMLTQTLQDTQTLAERRGVIGSAVGDLVVVEYQLLDGMSLGDLSPKSIVGHCCGIH